MDTQKMGSIVFSCNIRSMLLHVIYVIDRVPMKLLIGCNNPLFAININVSNGYEINSYLGDCYQIIYDAFGPHNGNGNWRPENFYRELMPHIPNNAAGYRRATYKQIFKHYRDIEEEDKIYFCGWVHNDGVKKKTSEANLRKTEIAFGHEIRLQCEQNQISSRWTDVDRDEVAFRLPIP